MKLISTPEVKFPEDFEVYDPKVTNNFDVSRSGLTGSQTIEYLSIHVMLETLRFRLLSLHISI